MRLPTHTLIAAGITWMAFVYTYAKFGLKRFDPVSIDLSQLEDDAFILKGFASLEPWGRWTVGDRASVTFRRLLPPKFRVVLSVQGFGPNINKPLKIRVGSEEHEILIPEKMQSVAVDFSEVDAFANQVLFSIPDAKSPQELNVSADPRKLGVGIKELRLEII